MSGATLGSLQKIPHGVSPFFNIAKSDMEQANGTPDQDLNHKYKGASIPYPL